MSIPIIVLGAAGKLGKEVIRVIQEKGLKLSAAIDKTDTGKPTEIPGINVTADLESVIHQCQVVIDFTSPQATMEHLAILKKHRKPVVIGTTGLTDEQLQVLKATASSIPVVYSPNMSIGMNCLFKLTELLARALSRDFDIEVIEAHHHFKKDAPSGTALKLVEILTKELKRDMKKDVVYGREGITGERKPKEIGVSAIRGGDIVGEHTVLFAGTGERIELVHRATSRSIFAKGAVMAAEWVLKQKSGLYSMFDVLGL